MGLDRVLHLHGLEHHDDLPFFDFLALFDGDLDDAALHRCGYGVAGHVCCRALPATLLRLLALVAPAQEQVARQGHLDAAAADLDDELLGGILFVVLGNVGGVGVLGQLVGPLFLDPLGVDREVAVLGGEGRIGEDCLVEGDNRGQALDTILRQGAAGTLNGGGAVRAPNDELGQHGIELAANDGTFTHAGVHTDTGARRLGIGDDGSGGRHEACGGVFAVNAEFDGVAVRSWGLGDGKLAAFGDAELLANQIEAGGFLGNGVLHLEACVDLKEGDETVRTDEVLHGARAVVAGLAADALC